MSRVRAAQVSHSVVILALLYIYRLKANNTICGATGSEFRLTTTALMMANKILDDNSAFHFLFAILQSPR